MTTTTTTTTTILMTPTWIRKAVARGVGLLVLVRILATQPAKTFLLTLACLSAGQACVMASSGKKKDDDDDDEDKEDKDKEEVGLGLLPDKRTEKVKINKEGGSTNTDLESYEMVEHDLEEKDIVEKNNSPTGKKILFKGPTTGSTIESQMMRSDTMGGVSVATDGKIADDNKNSRKIIADESPKIIEFVEEYCDNLIDAAVAEVLNEVVSQVVRTGADQE